MEKDYPRPTRTCFLEEDSDDYEYSSSKKKFGQNHTQNAKKQCSSSHSKSKMGGYDAICGVRGEETLLKRFIEGRKISPATLACLTRNKKFVQDILSIENDKETDHTRVKLHQPGSRKKVKNKKSCAKVKAKPIINKLTPKQQTTLEHSHEADKIENENFSNKFTESDSSKEKPKESEDYNSMKKAFCNRRLRKQNLVLIAPVGSPKLEYEIKKTFKQHLVYDDLIHDEVQGIEKNQDESIATESSGKFSRKKKKKRTSFKVASSVKNFYENKQELTDLDLTSETLNFASNAECSSEAISTSPSPMPEEMTTFLVTREAGGKIVLEKDRAISYLKNPFEFLCSTPKSAIKSSTLAEDCNKSKKNVRPDNSDICMANKSSNCCNIDGKGKLINENNTQKKKKPFCAKTKLRKLDLKSPETSYQHECVPLCEEQNPNPKRLDSEPKTENKKDVIEEIDELIGVGYPSENQEISLSDQSAKSSVQREDSPKEDISCKEKNDDKSDSSRDVLEKSGESVVRAIDDKVSEVKAYLKKTHISSTSKIARKEIKRIGKLLQELQKVTNEIESS